MTQSPEVSEAIQHYKAGQLEQSRTLLHAVLLHNPANMDALLWLAKITPDKREAKAAAELAFALQPENEVAQRAVVAVSQEPVNDGKAESPTLDVMRVTGMTISQARAVIWPFKNFRRPLGVLMDEGLVTLADLGFAVEKAYDEAVKKAAATLLLSRLLGEGLKAPPQPLMVLGRNRFAARQERKAALLFGVGMTPAVLGLLAMLALGGVYIYAFFANQTVLGIVANLGVWLVLGLMWLLSRWMEQQSQNMETARHGADGEERFVDALRASLNHSWRLYRNVVWPKRSWGDVDQILVGPGGVWVFEVKSYTSRVRNRGDQWEYKGRWGWRKLSQHPGQQARRNAVNVKNYLEQQGATPGFVQRVIIWAGDPENLTLQDPAVAVWTILELSERVNDLWQGKRLGFEQIEKCSVVLTNLIAQEEARLAKEAGK